MTTAIVLVCATIVVVALVAHDAFRRYINRERALKIADAASVETLKEESARHARTLDKLGTQVNALMDRSRR